MEKRIQAAPQRMEEDFAVNLVERNMTPCVKVDRSVVKDGLGGTKTTWTDGEKFSAAIAQNSSSQRETDGVHRASSAYTVTARKETVLKYHDSFKRLSDGKIFRATSDSNIPPVGSSFDMRQVTAEEWTEGNDD